ncbi:MAG: PA14 domain-containing protein [Verrucomicrobiota bacterium]
MKSSARYLLCLFGLSFVLGNLAHAFEAERWNNLPLKPSVLTLQQEGIAKRVKDSSSSATSASITAIPAGTGLRLRALLTPTVTGNYNLYISGSQNAALWLSTDASRFNKQRVAWHYDTTTSQQWTKFTTQKSATIQLTAGTSYYLEAQVMSGVANGHIALGWAIPGNATPTLIPFTSLSALPADPLDANDNGLLDSWEMSTGLAQSTIPNALRETADPDNDGIINSAEYALGSDPLTKESIANGITRDTWAALTGVNVTDLTHFHRTRFLSAPSEIIHAPGIDDPALGRKIGTRYRGFLVAPVTGDYRLWIAGNNMCELWFADGTVKHPDTNAALTNRFGKQRLAHNIGPADWYPSSYRGFDRLVSQRSRVVHLVQGQSYYIEVLQKEGDGPPSHISLAWQIPGQVRSVIPATAFLSDTPDDGDKDADFLPDAWETAKTLSPTDNGFTSALQGQYGDHDGDSLTNLDEFQYGTNPKSADTDGDGLSDFKEIFQYGSNPKVSNTLSPFTAATPNLHLYSAYTGAWNANANGSLSAVDQRGEITYTFTITEPGVHEVILKGAAIGTVRSVERLPIVLSLDSKGPFARQELVSNNGGQGTITGVTPWLDAGTHTLTILHDNYRAARRLRIDEIKFYHLGGQDLDEDGAPDWIEQNAATTNKLTRVPAESRTSPVSIEGITQNLPTATLSYNPMGQSGAIPLVPQASINDTFYADVPLLTTGAVALNASFLSGLVESSASITWVPTNLFETFTDDTLHIRKNDSLRLDAWSTASADGQPFTVTRNGNLLADENQNTTHTSGQPFVATFGTAGTYTLVATHGGNTATVTVKVHAADFGSALSVRAYSPRAWTPPSLGTLPLVEPDERLIFAETTANPQTGPRSFSAGVIEAGDRHVIARLPADLDGAPSAILARGTVNGFYLAYLNDTGDARFVQQYPDGTWLMSGTLITVNLPPDVLIKLRTHYQGNLLINGSNILWLSSDDFNANGIATIYFEWAGSGTPKICNHLEVFVEQ